MPWMRGRRKELFLLFLPPGKVLWANMTMRCMICVAGLVFWMLEAALGAAAFPPQGDLAHNGGFEQGTQYWQFLVQANATGQLDSAEKHEGKSSFKITNKSGQAPNVFARLVQTITGLQPFATYKASCWVKGRGCGNNWIGGGPGWYTRTGFPRGDFDWQQVSFEVNTGAEADNYELMVLTESQTEALWVDDVRFELAKVDQAKQDAVYAETDAKITNLAQRLAHLKNTNNAYIRLGTDRRATVHGFRQDRRPKRTNEPGLVKNAARGGGADP